MFLLAKEAFFTKKTENLDVLLNNILRLSKEQNDGEKQVEALILLGNYNVYILSNHQKALELMYKALELAKEHNHTDLIFQSMFRILDLQRSSGFDIYVFYNSISELKKTNEAIGNLHYGLMIKIWEAVFVGHKMYFNYPVSTSEYEFTYQTLLDNLNTFDPDDENEVFYYVLINRNYAINFPERTDFNTAQFHLEKAEKYAPKVSNQHINYASIIYRGIMYLAHDKTEELIDFFEDQEELKENGSVTILFFYYSTLSKAYEKAGLYKKQSESLLKMNQNGKEMNGQAFANKLSALERQHDVENLERKNTQLNRQFLATLIAFFSLLGILIFIARLWIKIRKQNQLINQQKEALNEINKAKNKLFGILAHDLRVPINSLNNLGGKINYLVKKREWDTLNGMADQIATKTENLNNLLANLLPWVANQVKNPVLEFSNLNLHRIVTSCIEDDHDKLYERNIRGDQGRGMDEDKQAALFSEYKSEQDIEGNKGLGLGLKLSKDLALSNQGNLTIESNIDGGITVILSLKQAKKKLLLRKLKLQN
jgi:signal transduction histidine kinase